MAMDDELGIRKGIRRAVRGKVFLALEKELRTEGRAIRTDFSPWQKTYLKLLAAAAIGGAVGILTVTSVYIVCVWLLHLQLY